MTEYQDFNTFSNDHGSYLKSAFIYGANGSGKSNLFKAIRYMRNMVMHSAHDEQMIKKNDYFRFLYKGNESPTSFEMVFQLDGLRWIYGFELLKGKVSREWLYKKNKRQTRVFKRTEPGWESIGLSGDWKKFEGIKEYTRDNALFLSLAAMLNIAPAMEIRTWFEELLIFAHDGALSPGLTIELLEEDHESKDLILSFLKKADFGIEDIEYDIEEMELPENVMKRFLEKHDLSLPDDKSDVRIEGKKVDVRTSHKVYDTNHQVVDSVALSFLNYQSTGTKKFFELLGPLLMTLTQGGTLIIDELDSRLHPLLVREIVSHFHSLDRNPNHAQLICNTHDVLLLDEEIRRDQIWFMQKNKLGSSELYSLSEFQGVRKDDPILKKYLLGIYGAVPFNHSSMYEVDHGE